ncbi:CheF family chemotaxis protein [Halosimplex halophilum]|uniref:CheF family chemotaxis protein n=1 Tax=Halosimplex halophilum TaxID=2559572 RepID=UPI00107FAA56|nr:CheF family chemotaxis protein [Halosimplex halophilum]
MSGDEAKLVDASGDYAFVVRDGEPVDQPRWRSSRVVLTSERVVLADADGNRSFPHGAVELVDDPDGVVPEGFPADGATALRAGNHTLLVDAPEVEALDREYCRAALDAEVILVKHPAVVGGVVQDTEWSKARFRFADDTVRLALPGGRSTSFPVEDVGTVETATQEVMGSRRQVVRLEHTDEEDRSVETHFSGTDAHCRALAHLFEAVVSERGSEEHELTETERQVLMALYSGVSPFEMSDFVGISVEEVEEIYGKLLEMDAVDEVRTRTEVSLNAHGRNLASEAMSEQ